MCDKTIDKINSHTSTTKEVKYHYPDGTTIVTPKIPSIPPNPYYPKLKMRHWRCTLKTCAFDHNFKTEKVKNVQPFMMRSSLCLTEI